MKTTPCRECAARASRALRDLDEGFIVGTCEHDRRVVFTVTERGGLARTFRWFRGWSMRSMSRHTHACSSRLSQSNDAE